MRATKVSASGRAVSDVFGMPGSLMAGRAAGCACDGGDACGCGTTTECGCSGTTAIGWMPGDTHFSRSVMSKSLVGRSYGSALPFSLGAPYLPMGTQEDPWDSQGLKRGAFRDSTYDSSTGLSSPGAGPTGYTSTSTSGSSSSTGTAECEQDIDHSNADYEELNGQFELDTEFGSSSQNLFILAMQQLSENVDIIERFYAQWGVSGTGSRLVNLIQGDAHTLLIFERLVKFKLDRGLCGAFGWTFPGIATCHINPDYVKAVARDFYSSTYSSSFSVSTRARRVASGGSPHLPRDGHIVFDASLSAAWGLRMFEEHSPAGIRAMFRDSTYDPGTGTSTPGDDPRDDIDIEDEESSSGTSTGTSSDGECECLIEELARTLLHEMAHVLFAGEKEAYLLESYYADVYETRNGFTHDNCCGRQHSLPSFDPSDYDSVGDVLINMRGHDFEISSTDGKWHLTACQSL